MAIQYILTCEGLKRFARIAHVFSLPAPSAFVVLTRNPGASPKDPEQVPPRQGVFRPIRASIHRQWQNLALHNCGKVRAILAYSLLVHSLGHF